jgi:hypothetical protein
MIRRYLVAAIAFSTIAVPARGQYCATYNDDATPEDCSFTTMQVCQQSVNGVGGYCAPQSEAPVMPPAPLFEFRRDPYAFAPAPIPPPPPPVAEPSSGPLQLPDSPQPQP